MCSGINRILNERLKVAILALDVADQAESNERERLRFCSDEY